jgi:hypothetical protein
MIFLRFGRVPREDFVVRAESSFMEGEPRGTAVISSAAGEPLGGAARSASSSEPRGDVEQAAGSCDEISGGVRVVRVSSSLRWVVCSESKIPDGVVFIQYPM